jgi:hypothetical protein
VIAALDSWLVRIAALVAVVATLAALWFVHLWRNEQAAHAKAALDASNAIARADTTREVYRDSVTRIVERLAVQSTTEAANTTAIDRVLHRTQLALDSLSARVRSIDVSARSSGDVTTSADDVRHGAFVVDSTPFHVRADVALPRTGPGTIQLAASLDPIPIGVRQLCGTPDANGIRPATVSATGPSWATIQLAHVEQDAGACRSPALTGASTDGRLRLAIVAGYGETFGFPFVSPSANGAERRAFLGIALAKTIPLPRWLPFH